MYYLKGEEEVVSAVREIFEKSSPVYISTVTEIELFGFHDLTDIEAGHIDEFLKIVSIIPLDSRIARLAGFLRRTHRLKLADSAIAATALFTGTKLLTRNTRDFKNVFNLAVQRI